MVGRRMKRTRRNGALLVEVSVAAVIAAVATAGVVQLVLVANGQLRKRENQALIVREVGNLMEDLFSRPWEELSARTAGGSAVRAAETTYTQCAT